jgi:hypothetical protein
LPPKLDEAHIRSLLKPGQIPRKALEYLVKEQGGEQLATHLQDMNEWAVLKPENSVVDYLPERPDAALQTALSTLFAGGGQAAVMGGVGKVLARFEKEEVQAERAESGAEALSKINQLIAVSKVAERSPETFEGFIAAATEDGPVTHVYIDAKTLAQSGLAEPLAAVSPSVAAQIADAAQTGGDIAIPVEEYAARIVPVENSPSLIQDLRVSPEGWTQREAKEYMQSGAASELKADIERLISEEDGDEVFRASREAVKQSILDEMNALGRFTKDVSEGYATLYSAYYAVRAAQMGMMPEALYQKRKVNFAAAEGTGEGLNQGAGRAAAERLETRHGSGRGAFLVERNDGRAGGVLDRPGRQAGTGRAGVGRVFAFTESRGHQAYS